jgi:hypothetical protein
VTKSFNRFINGKLATGELDRIVVDESHVVLDSTKTWRPKVLELAEFARRGCQMVYLTATLPPKEEPSWLEAMGLEKKQVRMIRDSTTRRNITYLEYDKQEEEERVADLVGKKLEEHQEGQIVVYCRRVEQCKKMGEVLRCPVYYRSVGDEAEKAKILEQLVRGTHRVFAATTPLIVWQASSLLSSRTDYIRAVRLAADLSYLSSRYSLGLYAFLSHGHCSSNLAQTHSFPDPSMAQSTPPYRSYLY